MIRPIRIGIWCDYGVTLTPTEGIGVFVYNLVGGLLELDEAVEVVLLVRPGDQKMAGSLVPRPSSRLRVVPEIWPTITQSPRLTRLFQAGIRWIAWTRQKSFRLERRVYWLRNQVRGENFSLPFAYLLSVALAAFSLLANLRRGTFLFLARPFNRLRGFRKLWQKLALVFDPTAVRESAECDVWLIPSFRLHYRLAFPSVLVIHDLVHVHYPDAVPGWDLEELGQLVPARSAEAAICACMSGFIRDHDLLGTLHLDPEKVRVIRPAPPMDSSESSAEQTALGESARLTRPYLFYPAAFRSYKNHTALVQALRLLRDKHDTHNLDLVFTGIHSIPQELSRVISENGLAERVHVLGCVNRAELDALYRNALATILPSLYEEVCFPVYEALQRGCPVALSRIPALVEQYRAMHDALLYFDPNDPEDLARTILRIREDREGIRLCQQAAAPALWARTWKQAARDWLKVLREAIELADMRSKTSAAA